MILHDLAMRKHKSTYISDFPFSLPKIFAEMKDTISKVDADADLKMWSLLHGVDMRTNFPKFQVSKESFSMLH